MDGKNGLMDDLVQAINRWLEGRKTRSLSMLAHRTNKAYSTIRYIAQSERVPNESTILAITDVVMTPWERVVFFKRYFPQIGELMEKAYAPDLKDEENHELLGFFIRKEPHNRIFNMAATSRGTTREAVGRLLGSVGEQAMEEMLEENFLQEIEPGRIRYRYQSVNFANVDDVMTQIRSSVNHLDRDLVGTDGSALVNMTASLRREDIPKVKQLISRFVQDLSALKNHPESEGDVPFFCNMIYSVYDKHQWLTD